MSAVTQTRTRATATWKAGDRWLFGVVLAVITFWLFAQTLLNVIPAIQGSLGLTTTVANLAVSVTALMSGLFIVVFGGLADHVGRGKIFRLGIAFSIVGSLLIVLTPSKQGALTATMMMGGRIVQGLSAACVMPSSLALIKEFYDDKARSVRCRSGRSARGAGRASARCSAASWPCTWAGARSSGSRSPSPSPRCT